MPNILDNTGLLTKSLQEIVNDILNGSGTYPGYYSIYGPSINVGPNSPDGQQINIFAQAAIDVEELLAAIYASFDPDEATGVVLDARCAINGVYRRAGTFTLQNVLVTVNQAVTLSGLDTAASAPFTVQDTAGNQFQLVSTYAFLAAGSASLQFQAATMGPVLTTPNTIVNIVSVLLGVTSVNNPSAATSIGTAEESDAALRIRRSNSVALPSRGYLPGMLGALLDTDGVVQAIVLENPTNSTDSNGVPAHSIWCIVLGGADSDVATTIYKKRNAGCGMKGATTINVIQVDGTLFPVSFDRPTPEALWIKFNYSVVTGSDPGATYIRTQLLAQLNYTINQPADASAIIALCKQIAPNCSFSAEGVSNDGSTYVSLLNPTAVNYQFSTSSPHTVINGSPGP